MLKQRIFTSIILIPCVIGLLFFAPYPLYDGVTAALMLLAAWEWSKLMGLQKLYGRLCYLGLITLLLILAYQWIVISEIILWIGSVGWTLIILTLVYLVHQKRTWTLPAGLVGMSGVFILIPCWVGLSVLRILPYGTFLILLLLLCVWAVDIGAYFAGRAWGRHKLAPLISPNKTREGCYGGGMAIALVIGIYSLWATLPYESIVAWFMLGLLIFVAAIAGDLFESLLKRGRDIKDSGSLLPGHGGILDRIDSLLAVVPLFTLSVLLFGEMLIV